MTIKDDNHCACRSHIGAIFNFIDVNYKQSEIFINQYKGISGTCEGTFSAMRRINNYIRSTMLPNRLSKLSVIAITRDLSSNLNKDDILDKFANTERRLKNLRLIN